MDELHSPHSHSTTTSNAPTSDHHTLAGDSSAVRSTGGAKYKLMSPAKLPISRSSSLTVPPGLSPTSFLESPVLLTNIKAEPSPTTGSFFKSPMMQRSIATAAFSLEGNSSTRKTLDDSNSGFFEFRPHTHTTSVMYLCLKDLLKPALLSSTLVVLKACQNIGCALNYVVD